MVTGVCLGKEDGLVALRGGAGSMAKGSLWGSERQGWGVLATLQRSRGRVSLHTPSLPPSTTATASLCSGCPTCPRGAHLSWLPCGPSPPVGLSLLGCSDDATLHYLLASPQQSVAYGCACRNCRLREVRGAPGLTQLPRESDVRWHQNSGLLPSHVHCLSLHQASQHGGQQGACVPRKGHCLSGGTWWLAPVRILSSETTELCSPGDTRGSVLFWKGDFFPWAASPAPGRALWSKDPQGGG